MYFLLAGYASAGLDRSWRAEIAPTDFRRVLLPLLAGYSVILLRGSLLQAMGQLTAFSLLVWFLCAKTSRRGRSTEAHHTPVSEQKVPPPVGARTLGNSATHVRRSVSARQDRFIIRSSRGSTARTRPRRALSWARA